MTDRQFMAVFIAVMGALVLIGVLAFFIARIVASGEGQGDDPLAQKRLEERIAPVGQVYVGSVPPEATAAGQQASSKAEGESSAPAFASGKDVYDAVCVACHGTGAAGAPKFGDKAAWEPYLKDSVEQIYEFALNGKGAMPPKGGRADLSEEQLKSAVDHMLEAVN